MHALAYSPDGNRLLNASADKILVVTLRDGSCVELARPELVDAAWVGNAIWSVAGSPPMLEIEGRVERIAIPSGVGRFAGHGWIGDGVFRLEPAGMRRIGSFDLAIELTSSRVITCVRGAIQLRREQQVQWTTPVLGRAVEIALLFEGRAVAVHLREHTGNGVIVVLDTRTGAVQHKLVVASATCVRFADRRGLAAVLVETAELVLVDLRFGGVVARHRLGAPARGLAIDRSGERIALRSSHDGCDLAELDVATVMREIAPVATSTMTVVDELREVEPPQIAPALAEVVAPTELPVLRALPRRIAAVAPSPAHARALFAAERTLVVALVRLAIATMWDEGRAAPDGAAPIRALIESANGTVHGLAGLDLAIACTELERALDSWWRAIRAARPGVAPLHQLVDDYGLDEVDQLVTLVIAAPKLWLEVAPLYRLFSRCDEQLVTQLLAPISTPAQIAASLDSDARLVRRGLVHYVGSQRPFAELAIQPVALRRLRAANPLDALDSAVTVRAATCDFAAFRMPAALKHRITAELARSPGPLRVVVRGRPHSGRRTLCALIASTCNFDLGLVDLERLDLEALSTTLRATSLARLIPCLVGLETVHSPAARDRVRSIVAAHPGPVLVRMPADVDPPIEPGYVAIDLPPQTLAERSATWSEALGRVGLAVAEPDTLAARFALGPGAISRVVAQVARDGSPEHAIDRVEATVRQHLDSELGAIATRVTRLPTWSRVVLPAEIRDSLVELVGRVRHRRTVYDTWGFDRVMSTSRGLTALFQGGPGTGKTLVAGAIANELGLDLYRVDVSRVMSKWIGETEKNLGRLFDAADDGNAILLFDEADSLFTKRTDVKSSNDRFANLEVNYLLQRLDSFGGVAILTTNFGTAIDDAFKRRLSVRLTFPFPDEEQREELWRAHLPSELPVRGALDLAGLARRYQLSGGYIRNCALRAAFLAAEQGGTLTADHLERAVRAEFRELGKLSTSGILE